MATTTRPTNINDTAISMGSASKEQLLAIGAMVSCDSLEGISVIGLSNPPSAPNGLSEEITAEMRARHESRYAEGTRLEEHLTTLVYNQRLGH